MLLAAVYDDWLPRRQLYERCQPGQSLVPDGDNKAPCAYHSDNAADESYSRRERSDMVAARCRLDKCAYRFAYLFQGQQQDLQRW